MDKETKFLRKLDSNMRLRVIAALANIYANSVQSADTKPLQGYKNMYRYRVGDVRIIYQCHRDGNTVEDIDFRGNIYKRW